MKPHLIMVVMIISEVTMPSKGVGILKDLHYQDGHMIGVYEAGQRERARRAFASFRFRPKGKLNEL